LNWDESTELSESTLQSYFKLPFLDRVDNEEMLLFQQFVHSFFGIVRLAGIFSVRHRAFSNAAAGNEDHGLEKMGTLPGLALHVIERVSLPHIGVKPEDHGRNLFPITASAKSFVNAAFPSACALDTLARRSL
jgi:hypothetical protein